MRIESRAPTRIDLGGGWTDVPPYPETAGGFVCNVAIARHATVLLRTGAGSTTMIEDRGARWSGEDLHSEGGPSLAKAALRHARVRGVELVMASDFPAGAGLGGSSAAGVALTAALAELRGEGLSRTELAERSREVEVEELGVAGGRQDHYAAALGGALALTFGASVEARRIPLAADAVQSLQRRFVIAYTGESRISGDTITAVIDAFRAREARVTAALARMKSLAVMMAEALERASIDELGLLVGEHWQHQRSLHPRITTKRIERVMQAGSRAGALGGKALGASGGGCVLLIASEDNAEGVRAAASEIASILPFGIDQEGVRVHASR